MRGSFRFSRIGNKAYKHAFPAYRFSYRIFKAYADRAERQLLQKILFAGAVVVDAGANIGIYSEFLSRCVGPDGARPCVRTLPRKFQTTAVAPREICQMYTSARRRLESAVERSSSTFPTN